MRDDSLAAKEGDSASAIFVWHPGSVILRDDSQMRYPSHSHSRNGFYVTLAIEINEEKDSPVANHQHQKLRDKIMQLDTLPDDTKMSEWLTGESHLAFIEEVSGGEEIILAASGPCTYVRSVVVPASRVDEVPTDQRARWFWDGGDRIAIYDWTNEGSPRIERTPAGTDGWLIDGCPLAIQRSIEERVGQQQTYWVPDQEFLHVSEGHWREERNAYARLAPLGEWVDVITITNQDGEPPIDLVTCNRDTLDDYLVATESVLILLFDLHNDLRRDNPLPIECTWIYGKAIAKGPLCYFTDRDASATFAITKGSSIIEPKLDRDRIAKRIRSHGVDPSDSVPISLLAANQWRDDEEGDRIRPVQTTATFEAIVSVDEDDWLTRYSPAFFNSEVLSRYAADPDRWSVANDRIRCRGGWRLREYHTNEAGQVWALIEDLRKLPRRELEHWRQHNEAPISPVTEADLQRTFFGELSENPEPLPEIQYILSMWTRINCSWWTLREDGAIERLAIPVSGARKAWEEAIVALFKVVIEGFDKSDLTARLEQAGGEAEQKWGSIRVLEKLLAFASGNAQPVRLSAINDLRELRNGIAHPKSDGGLARSSAELARHGSYRAAYEHLCRGIADELQQIQDRLSAS